MSDETDELAALCDQAVAFSARLAGPLKRIAVRRGDVSVEVDWHDATPSLEQPVRVGPSPAATALVGAAAAGAGAGSGTITAGANGSAAPANGQEHGLAQHEVSAPLVGTFYRASAPGAAPFVAVGDAVVPGQTLAIIEAMKLMNPIVADVAGTVCEVLTADGASVEFEQPLVRLALAGATTTAQTSFAGAV